LPKIHLCCCCRLSLWTIVKLVKKMSMNYIAKLYLMPSKQSTYNSGMGTIFQNIFQKNLFFFRLMVLLKPLLFFTSDKQGQAKGQVNSSQIAAHPKTDDCQMDFVKSFSGVENTERKVQRVMQRQSAQFHFDQVNNLNETYIHTSDCDMSQYVRHDVSESS